MVTPTVNAECVKATPKMLLDAPAGELIFAGKVVEVTGTGEFGAKATFEVERVWRGKVPRRFEVYTWYLASAEAPRYLYKGQSYVVVAQPLTDKRARDGVGLGSSDRVAFTGVPCSDLYPVEEVVRELGGGKPPIDEPEEKIRR